MNVTRFEKTGEPQVTPASDGRLTISEPDGRAIETLPRGFYLRATFTAGLLRRHFLLP